MSRFLFFILFGLASVAVFSEGMSSRSVGNSQAYPRNVVQTPDGFAQVNGFTNAAQRTTATTLGYSDDQAGSTAYKAAVADTGNAANCQAAYSKTCGQLTKTQYTAVLTMQSQTLSVSVSASSLSVGGTATLTTTGNQSTVTYTASGACTVSGSTVTASDTGGSCTITANAPIALPTYKAAAPTNISITVVSSINGYTNAAQRTAALALGYTDNQAGATLYQAALADTGNAATCQAAYSVNTCGQLTKTQYSAVLALQSQTLSVSANPNSLNRGGTATLTTSGNRSTVTYTASGACTVSGSTVTASDTEGTCSITANAPYTAGYKAAAATNISITVSSLVEQQFTLTGLHPVTPDRTSWSLSGPVYGPNNRNNGWWTYTTADPHFQQEGHYVDWIAFPPETCFLSRGENRTFLGLQAFKIPAYASAVAGTCHVYIGINAYTSTYYPYTSYAGLQKEFTFEVVK